MQEPQVCLAHQHLVNRLPILSCQLLVRCLRASEGRGRPGRVRGRGPRAAVNSASVVASAASCAAFTTSTSSRSPCRRSPWRASARSLAVLMMLPSPRPPAVPRLPSQWVEQTDTKRSGDALPVDQPFINTMTPEVLAAVGTGSDAQHWAPARRPCHCASSPDRQPRSWPKTRTGNCHAAPRAHPMTGRSCVVDQTSRLNSPMACGMSVHGSASRVRWWAGSAVTPQGRPPPVRGSERHDGDRFGRPGGSTGGSCARSGICAGAAGSPW